MFGPEIPSLRRANRTQKRIRRVADFSGESTLYPGDRKPTLETGVRTRSFRACRQPDRPYRNQSTRITQLFSKSSCKSLNYDIRAFQKVLFHTKLFRREMHREDHSMGIKFHFAGPLLKRMSAEQIWDSITTLILPNVDTYAPNRKRILDRIARTEAIYQSLEGRPFEEVLPR